MEWQPTPVFLPGKFHGQRSLEGYSPRGRTESDTTEQTLLQLPTTTMTEQKDAEFECPEPGVKGQAQGLIRNKTTKKCF